MRHINCFALILSLLLVLPSWGLSQEKGAIQESEGKTDSYSIDDFAWIAGHWRGEAMGGSFEETWNPPFGGTMMGMFKFVQGEKVNFHEILTIVYEDEQWMLRLKHFDDKLAGWEEKEESVKFPLVRLTETEAIFDGLKFLKVDQETMHIVVKTQQGEEIQELKFVCKKVVASDDE